MAQIRDVRSHTVAALIGRTEPEKLAVTLRQRLPRAKIGTRRSTERIPPTTPRIPLRVSKPELRFKVICTQNLPSVPFSTIATVGCSLRRMIVTIDGPAGSGKSTAARKLAARLEIAYLDTGAMYRAIALAALQNHLDLGDENAITQFAQCVDLEVDCGATHARVRVDDHDVTEALRSIEVSRATSRIARFQGVRDRLVSMQREIGAKLEDFVTEGRDQGSVVFPGADFRFILEACVDVRARRRYQEMQADGQDVRLQDVANSIRERDSIDAKQWEPLVKSGAAVVIDTTRLTVAQVIDLLAETIARSGDS